MTKLLRRKNHKPKHVLFRIKNELKLSQAEIPESLGISLDTFKNIVQGKVKSWNEHATNVSRAAGVSVKSLLANDAQKPLLANDGKRWTAQKYQAGIAARYVGDLVRERSRGRHTLQFFRIIMISVARCLLAAYRDKKSTDAIFKLLKAIKEIGVSFPTYTAKIPPKPGEAFMTVGDKTFQPDRCPSQDWSAMLQATVATIDSTSLKGVEIIFDRFKNDILKEESMQGEKLRFDLIEVKEKARKIHSASQVKSAKPTRR
jgi:transcriptional regulator with XRE-family HTH domain